MMGKIGVDRDTIRQGYGDCTQKHDMNVMNLEPHVSAFLSQVPTSSDVLEADLHCWLSLFMGHLAYIVHWYADY